MVKDITKKYTNGEVTILWQPALCIHSAKCFLGLPAVFDPTKRPWVNPEGADTQKMIGQVKQCPSGALSYFMNKEENKMEKEYGNGLASWFYKRKGE